MRRTAAPGERCSAHGYAADDLGYARYDHGNGADLLDTCTSAASWRAAREHDVDSRRLPALRAFLTS
ncbi:hypothetical protein [Pseudonocardia sp.]|uniref:hypothetical protein n=1 Tax=Pseudonocardia sp. TaxID=60912 RepID=UPI0031FD830A